MLIKPTTGPLDWLQLIFIYLKLTNQIEWAWPLVLAPLIAIYSSGFFLYVLKESLILLQQYLTGDDNERVDEQAETGETHESRRLPEDAVDTEDGSNER